MEVGIKLGNGIRVVLTSTAMGLISRNHLGKLELDFNPESIDVINSKGEDVCTLSGIKVDNIFDKEVITGYDLDTSATQIFPIGQVSHFLVSKKSVTRSCDCQMILK